MLHNDLPLTVDVGFSAAKGLLGNRTCRVKTACRRDELHGEEYQGVKLSYGDGALKQAGSVCLMDLDDLVRYHPLYVAAAADKFRVTKAPALAVGLPYDFWRTEVLNQNSGQSNRIAELANALRCFRVGGQEYVFEEVRVYPQGLGAVMAFLRSHPDVEGDTLCVDMGFNSVIYCLYSRLDKRIVGGKTYYRKGTFELVQTLLKPIVARHNPGKTFSPAELNVIFERKEVPNGIDTIGISAEIKQLGQNYALRLLEEIAKEIKLTQGAEAYRNIVFCGGGARLLAEFDLTGGSIQIFVPEEPEFQNAIGYDLLVREEFGMTCERAA